VDYDPQVISYADLLKLFWATHNPCRSPYSRQYMSGIFFSNEDEKKAALASKEKFEAERGKSYTEIMPLKEFYVAEDYHQKYRLRQEPELMREFTAMYPKAVDLMNSTAAARVNAYLAGYGKREQVVADLPKLGLSEKAQKYVEQATR